MYFQKHLPPFAVIVEVKHSSKGNADHTELSDHTSHSAAALDCGNVVMLPEVLLERCSSRQILCAAPARLLANRKAAGIIPLLPFKHGICGHHF